jgi:hypothetical protein
MTPADITLAAFTLCNSLRVLAYLPQIARAARDEGGAQAISFATWGLFLLSNLSAVAYALVNKDDWTMAAVFFVNGAGCTAILLIGAWKRAQYRRRMRTQPPVRVRLSVATGPGGRTTLNQGPAPRRGMVGLFPANRPRRSRRPFRRW